MSLINHKVLLEKMEKRHNIGQTSIGKEEGDINPKTIERKKMKT